MKAIARLFTLIALLPAIAFAGTDQTTAEVEYLLMTMSASDCTFIRNGKEYDATDAESHLRMKYQRGKRYAPTTELFIERLASKSSMSGKPYLIDCEGEERTTSAEWLTALLEEFRASLANDEPDVLLTADP